MRFSRVTYLYEENGACVLFTSVQLMLTECVPLELVLRYVYHDRSALRTSSPDRLDKCGPYFGHGNFLPALSITAYEKALREVPGRQSPNGENIVSCRG